MKQEIATGLGFFVASIVPAVYLAVAFPLSGDRNLQSVLGSFVVFYFFAAAATIVLGIPSFLVLRKLKLVTWWSAVASGAFVGALALVAVTFAGGIDLTTLLRYAALGGAGGFIFWAFWRAGRN